ncbi:ogr/Delta-like zinc finger family protein [Aeromonas veronii]|uniref:ogr/Delta-like zinc finger family protein n=1 Tax=Aeromonas veronii TaxID=654 RepID=UPI003D251719
MRVICIECGALGRITKTNHLSEDVADLYCQCTDKECRHRWVSRLSFSHTITPARKHLGDLALASLTMLSVEQKEVLADVLEKQLIASRDNEVQAKNKTIYRRNKLCPAN